MNLMFVAPEASLITLALVVLLLDLVVRNKTTLATISLVGLLAPLGFTLALWTQQGSFLEAVAVDPYSLFFKLFFLGISACWQRSNTPIAFRATAASSSRSS
jgi:NADH-quinone oxidoreductase subunit N